MTDQSKGKPPLFEYTNPGGLIGSIGDFTYTSAPRPHAGIALAAGIGLTAALVGRAYQFDGNGLNQYLVALARTGNGKNAAQTAIGKIAVAVEKSFPEIWKYIGDRPASAQALRKSLVDKPSQVAVIDEYGEIFRRMVQRDRYKNENEFMGELMELYTASHGGGASQGIIHSDSTLNAKRVRSPAYSFIGLSVPETFYEAISPAMTETGLLPRYSIMDCDGPRPKRNLNAANVFVPPQLVGEIASLAAHVHLLNGAITLGSAEPWKVVASDCAMELFEEFEVYCDRQIDKYLFGVERDIWTRTVEKAKRLAALVAVGHNYLEPKILIEHAEWATNFANHDAELIAHKFKIGEVGPRDNENERIRIIIEKTKQWFLMSQEKAAKLRNPWPVLWVNGIIPRSWLQQHVKDHSVFKSYKGGPNDGLTAALRAMVNAGHFFYLSSFEVGNNVVSTADMYRLLDTAILE